MTNKKESKIAVNPDQSGLNSAFSSLLSGVDTSSLPEGQEATVSNHASKKPRRGRVVLRKETAHRGGKTVIVVHDFEHYISLSQIETLAKQIRKACGTGGTVKDRHIEIQGEHAPKIRALLQDEGFQVAGV